MLGGVGTEAAERAGFGTLYVGTSGFAFPQWKGAFYPSDLKDREMLAFYATRFRSVEINYTFRRDPARRTLEAWTTATPESFRFVLKANQSITHYRRLTDPERAIAFLETAAPLGDRLGPILFQCPPNMKRDPGRLEAFLDALPAGSSRYAFEFRHPSWDEDRSLLADRGAAWVVSDTDEQPWAEDALPGGGFVYLRLRRSSYDRRVTARWGRRIRSALADGADVFCFVKHEDAAGPELALGFERAAARAEPGSAVG
jgi:uncharacterized protein YecE (DUF72 family)